MFLPTYITEVLDRLKICGFEAFLVGGCVRDFLMNKAPKDYDVTTNALPEQILDCFSTYRTLTNGMKHGTVSVVFGKDCVEITTYRIDGNYADNRHPQSVTFTPDIRGDLARRDFTMNAVCYNPSVGFVDLFDGKKHIEEHRIVCVGEPDVRFNEDGLRIMRGLRFSSVLDFDIDVETAKSIHKNAHLLHNISVERIFSELSKLIAGKRAGKVFAEYKDVLEEILPCFTKASNEEYIRMCRALDRSESELILRFCILFSLVGTDEAKKSLEFLKSDNTTKNMVCDALGIIGADKSDQIALKKLISKNGFYNVYNALKTLLAFEANSKTVALLEYAAELENNDECLFIGQLAVNGNELSESCGVNGREIGELLSRLLDDVINGKVKNDRDELLNTAKKYCVSGVQNEE